MIAFSISELVGGLLAIALFAVVLLFVAGAIVGGVNSILRWRRPR